MSADYQSTARILALPVSPPDSPDHSQSPVLPSWRRSSPSGKRNFKQECMHIAGQLQKHAYKAVRKLTIWQRALLAIALVLAAVFGILFLVFNQRIFAWLEPYADKWRAVPAGWLIIWALTFLSAFPPLIGYSTCVTVAGFLYGLPNGWFVVASATVIGSTCSFIVSRTLLSTFSHRLVETDKRFAALALTLKHDGLKLLVMIRLCPLPYSLSNGAMSTFPTVHPLMYGLATAIASPRLIIYVFIGGRLGALAKHGGKMDFGTKVVNYASIATGSVFAIVVGWTIYQRTMARARQLEAEEEERLNGPVSHDEETISFSDDFQGGANRRANDEISLSENRVTDADYRDGFSDNGHAFAAGDDEDERTSRKSAPEPKRRG